MRGYQSNKTVGEIATDLRTKFAEMRSSRSELIANMELNYASSQGTLETMKRNKVDKKKWLTVDDERVRPTHLANQQQGAIAVTDAFSSGDDAPPADFNCRCTITEAVDDMWTPPAEVWAGN